MMLAEANNIYLVGIKGQGMTGLAVLLKSQGKQVSGSDVAEKFNTEVVLKNNNIPINEGFKAVNLPTKVDLVVYSTAYSESNPEINEAKQRAIRLLSYPEALGELSLGFKSIAVCGSHGKTTVTAMLSFILKEAGLSPSAIIGSPVIQLGGNALVGSGDLLVFEADEYQNKFQYYHPQIIILTSIDWDHPDWFKSREVYRQVFVDLLKKIPSDGLVIANADDQEVKEALDQAGVKREQIIYYGLSSGDWQLVRMWLDQGRWHFSVAHHDEFVGDFWLKLIGSHNVANALACLACAVKLGVTIEQIRTSLTDFLGTVRRFEEKGKLTNQAILVDDYAHHPKEIQATLKAARDYYPYKNIRVVFHPHTYSRTEVLLQDFATSFGAADEVIVLDIYASAREKQGNITSQTLVAAIAKHHTNTKYISTIDEAVKYLESSLTRSDLVITMGAGDVWQVGEKLIKKLGLSSSSEFK